MKAGLARVAALGALLAAGATTVLVWNPQAYLFKASFGISPQALQRINLLTHLFPQNPQLAAILWGLALVGTLLAVLTPRIELAVDEAGDRRAAEALGGPASILGTRQGRVLLFLLAAHVLLWVGLFLGYYHWGLFYLWAISLFVVGWQWHALDTKRGIPFAYPFDMKEVTFLVVLGCAFILYCSWDLDHWRYSFMGDEFGFWGFARYIVMDRYPDGRQGIVNAFTEMGVNDYHPMLCSLYQSWFMRLLGVNSYSWRMSSVFAAVLAFPGFYLFLREVISKPAAVAGTMMLAGNHFLLTYAHHGLNNVHVVAPTVAAIGLWAWGSRRHDLLAFYASGVVAGLGFYTFYSSRLAVGFVGLALILVGRGMDVRRRVPLLLAFLLGFFITVVPLIAASPNFIGDMLHQTVMRENATETHVDGSWDRLWSRLINPDTLTKWEACWIDPIFSMRLGRFMYGSWVDAWTGSLFFLGFIWTLWRGWRRPFLRWLLACYFVSVVVVGVLTQHPYPTDTRMLFLVPFYITFAVLILDVVRRTLQPGSAELSRIGGFVVGVAALLSVALNQYRYVIEAPALYHIEPFGLVTKVAQTTSPDRRIYFLSAPVFDMTILYDLGTMYLWADRIETLRAATLADGRERIQRPAVVLISQRFLEPGDRSLEILKERYPIERIEQVQDGPAHSVLQAVFIPAEGD